METKMEEIIKILKSNLSEERYSHSVGTSKMAKELALIYGENEEEAEIAGLVHDIQKELTKEEIKEALKKYNIEPDIIEKNNPGLLHAKLGAMFARNELGLNEKIQNAIKYHTTGKINMNTFDKIIYIADKIEENRNYEGVEEFRNLAKKNIDQAMLKFLDYTIKKSISKERLLHPDTIDLRNELILERGN